MVGSAAFKMLQSRVSELYSAAWKVIWSLEPTTVDLGDVPSKSLCKLQNFHEFSFGTAPQTRLTKLRPSSPSLGAMQAPCRLVSTRLKHQPSPGRGVRHPSLVPPTPSTSNSNPASST